MLSVVPDAFWVLQLNDTDEAGQLASGGPMNAKIFGTGTVVEVVVVDEVVVDVVVDVLVEVVVEVLVELDVLVEDDVVLVAVESELWVASAIPTPASTPTTTTTAPPMRNIRRRRFGSSPPEPPVGVAAPPPAATPSRRRRYRLRRVDRNTRHRVCRAEFRRIGTCICAARWFRGARHRARGVVGARHGRELCHCHGCETVHRSTIRLVPPAPTPT